MPKFLIWEDAMKTITDRSVTTKGDRMSQTKMGDSFPFPTIDIQLRGLTEHIVAAFAQRLDEIKAYAIAVIDASMNQLREKGLEQAIMTAVEKGMTEAIDKAIKENVSEAITDYFAEGGGQDFIVAAILRQVGETDEKEEMS